MKASLILAQCSSFEKRGPAQASLTEVQGHRTFIHRQDTDWSDVVGDKPVTDNRCSDLADLYPRPRAVLSQILGEIESSPQQNPGLKFPSMG